MKDSINKPVLMTSLALTVLTGLSLRNYSQNTHSVNNSQRSLISTMYPLLYGTIIRPLCFVSLGSIMTNLHYLIEKIFTASLGCLIGVYVFNNLLSKNKHPNNKHPEKKELMKK